jgi:hypothetical protein
MFRQYGRVNSRIGRRFIFEVAVLSLQESVPVHHKTKQLCPVPLFATL